MDLVDKKDGLNTVDKGLTSLLEDAPDLFDSRTQSGEYPEATPRRGGNKGRDRRFTGPRWAKENNRRIPCSFDEAA